MAQWIGHMRWAWLHRLQDLLLAGRRGNRPFFSKQLLLFGPNRPEQRQKSLSACVLIIKARVHKY